jgi:hypothetical protein
MLLSTVLGATTRAQGEMPVRTTPDQKYYVVIAVIVIVVIGFFIYLFAVDRKISKFERKSRKPD